MRDSTLKGKGQEEINLVVHLIHGPVNNRFRISILHSSQNQNKFRTYVLENFVPCRMTFSTASRKSRSVATFRRARMANIPASVATDRSSAPVELGHNRAIKSKRISRSTLILKRENQVSMIIAASKDREWTNLRAWIRRICARPSLSGRPNSTRRSNRPGRRSAGSRVSGLRPCQ